MDRHGVAQALGRDGRQYLVGLETWRVWDVEARFVSEHAYRWVLSPVTEAGVVTDSAVAHLRPLGRLGRAWRRLRQSCGLS